MSFKPTLPILHFSEANFFSRKKSEKAMRSGRIGYRGLSLRFNLPHLSTNSLKSYLFALIIFRKLTPSHLKSCFRAQILRPCRKDGFPTPCFCFNQMGGPTKQPGLHKNLRRPRPTQAIESECRRISNFGPLIFMIFQIPPYIDFAQKFPISLKFWPGILNH